MKRLLLTFLWLLGLLPGFSQQSEIHFTRSDIYKGLSNNQVPAIYRDEQGFAWIGTASGLNRYDGYVFKIYRSNAADTTSLSDNFVDRIYPYPGNRLLVQTHAGENIYNPITEKFDRNYALQQRKLNLPDTTGALVTKDAKGNYWFLYRGLGIWQYKSGHPVKAYTAQPNSPVRLFSNNVTGMAEANDGMLWIVYADGMLQKLDWHSGKIAISTDVFKNSVPSTGASFAVYGANNGDCWIYYESEAMGAYRVSFAGGQPTIAHYQKKSPSYTLNADIVRGISEDKSGNTWIATDHGGINIVNRRTGKVSYLVNNTEDPGSISQNAITSLYRDKSGIIWVGTYKQGFNYFNQDLALFPLYKHVANAPSSLPYDDVNRFAEDAKGNLWIGTNGGGLLYYDRSNGAFKRWMAGPGSISNNVIVSLCIDSDQNLWIGTYFGGLDKYDGKTFQHYRHDPLDSNSIADDRIWEIFEDSQKQLWIGTLTAGLDRFDRATNKFIHYKPGMPNSVGSNYISALLQDKQGRLWIGTSDGVDVLSNGRFTHFQNLPGESNSLSNNTVIDLLEDSQGLIWIGTREGLSIYDPAARHFHNFSKQDGFPDNTILKILEASNGEFWISTPNGLSQVNLQRNANTPSALRMHINNYDEFNNLQAREFNENAALKTSKGELIFGGPFGFNLFQPAAIQPADNHPGILLTAFDLFNKPVEPGEKVDGKIVLKKSISTAKDLTLRYNQNLFSISFAAIDFAHADRDKYAYTLEGFNKGWFITEGDLRRATFTNLDPGDYVFRVRSVNADGTLGAAEASLSIHILPPFWLTPGAYLVYVLLFAACLWLARRILLQRAAMRFALEQEREEAKRMHELDLMKIRFITNVSHEFRTPLSLILTPMDKLVKTAGDSAQQKQLQLVFRNAKRLLNLVNQLLDFRRMEVQEFVLQPREGDLVAFVKDISYSFIDIAEKKNIHFSFYSSIDSLLTAFDTDKMEKILFNLLGNAYKFTPEGGEVSLSITSDDSRQLMPGEKKEVLIKVSDTGIGIPVASREKIFERFFQSDMPGNMLNQGSGIGLAIVKEFVRLHQGSIAVESEVNMGSCFTIKLPLNVDDVSTVEAGNAQFAATTQEDVAELKRLPLKGKRATILIVEDNEDFRFYLKDNLGLHYKVLEAANGKDAWKQVQELQPDLVVSDIMMPVMNGLDLAKRIKHDPRSAGIPVILLTARTAEEQHLEGLDTGANDYITKPFSFEILLSRIRNLLDQQRVNKKTVKHYSVTTTDAVLESEDGQLVAQALQLTEANMGNADFSVELLSRELHLSRVGLYKKLLSLTGKTPIEFIKQVRMSRARQLLQESKMTVAEVAYEVGFNDPKYFAKAFKKEFGVLPSAVSGNADLIGKNEKEL